MARGKGVRRASITAVTGDSPKGSSAYASKGTKGSAKGKEPFVFLKSFSPEIIAAITFYLRDDKESLRLCSTVSKTWSMTTAQYMFKSFRWPPCEHYWGKFSPSNCSCTADEEGLATLLSFLGRSERVRQAIQSLRLSFCRSKKQDIRTKAGGVAHVWAATATSFDIGFFFDAVGKLPKLHTLSLHRPKLSGNTALASRPHCIPLLRHLAFEELVVEDNAHHALADLLGGFAHISRLIFESSVYFAKEAALSIAGPSAGPASGTLPLIQVDSLEFPDPHKKFTMPVFLDIFTKHPIIRLSTLEGLVLGPAVPEDDTNELLEINARRAMIVNKFLHTTSGLRMLTIDLTGSNFAPSISHLARLSSITVRGKATAGPAPMSDLPHMVTLLEKVRLAATSLRQVSVYFNLETEYGVMYAAKTGPRGQRIPEKTGVEKTLKECFREMKWKELDDFLARCDELEGVEIHIIRGFASWEVDEKTCRKLINDVLWRPLSPRTWNLLRVVIEPDSRW